MLCLFMYIYYLWTFMIFIIKYFTKILRRDFCFFKNINTATFYKYKIIVSGIDNSIVSGIDNSIDYSVVAQVKKWMVPIDDTLQPA